MTLQFAILNNPFDSSKGNLSAYCRYLRYNVDGFYNKPSKEVKLLYLEYIRNDKSR